MGGLSSGPQAKGYDARCPRAHPPFTASLRSGGLSPHSSLWSACQWPSATEAGLMPKPARRPAAGTPDRRTGRKAANFGAELSVLQRCHDNHRRVDAVPAGLPIGMGKQFMIIPHAPSAQPSASACRAAAKLVLWPIVPERGKAQHHQSFHRRKTADRSVENTAMTTNNLLPNLLTRSGRARSS